MPESDAEVGTRRVRGLGGHDHHTHHHPNPNPDLALKVGLKKLEEWMKDDREENRIEEMKANPGDPHLTEPRKPLVEEAIPLGKPPIVRYVHKL